MEARKVARTRFDEATQTVVKIGEVDECPNCHRVGYYYNLSNNRRQCRGQRCLTMWRTS